MENFTMLQYFRWYRPADGSLWKEVINEAAELKTFGIDTPWLPPAHKDIEGKSSAGDNVYDHYDLGELGQRKYSHQIRNKTRIAPCDKKCPGSRASGLYENRA